MFGFGRKPAPRKVLPLYIPIPVGKPDGQVIASVETAWGQVVEKNPGPLVLLHEANLYLARINPMPLPYEQRARISAILLNQVAGAIGTLFARFYQEGGGVPETPEQRDGISHAVRAAEQLAISYKMLFRQDWISNGHDEATREKILLSVMRILECVRLEQLLRAFRYQKLPQHVWRDVNQLFFAIRKGWDTHTKYSLKIRMAVEDESSRMGLFPQSASIEQFYLSIQFMGLIDVISWPVHLMFRADHYLGEGDIVMVGEDERGGAIPAGHIIVNSNQGTPPRFTRIPDQQGSSLLIDINPLMRLVTLDRDAVVSSRDESAISKGLRRIPPRDRLAFLDLLLARIQPYQRRYERERAIAERRARVYGGFDSVYGLFSAIARKSRGEVTAQEDQPLWDGLANPGILTVGNVTADKPRWIVADEGLGGVQLRQQESDYSLPLQVGRLVAYSHGGEESKDSRLGYVVRLQRLMDDEVEVAIARIGEHAQAVAIERPDAVERQTLEALLIHDKSGNLQLLCDNKHDFKVGNRLMILEGDRRYTGVLGGIMLSQAEFSVFELNTSG